MTHLSGEQMLSLHYGEEDDELKQHLNECSACQSEFRQIQQVLHEADKLSVPERADDYGTQVWRRIQPSLPVKRQKSAGWRWIWLGPVFAAAMTVAFLIGIFTQRHASERVFSEQARTRVLLIAMSDHLERSQRILAEFVNTDPANGLSSQEQTNARNLLAENRLLREMTGRAGDPLEASVLDQLERVLMDVVNGPPHPSDRQLQELQDRIRNEGLLLRVRMLGANALKKERKS